MDTKLKISLSIVLGGYISSLGFYFTWYCAKSSYSIYEMLYSEAAHFEIIAVVFAITALYFLFFLLILSIRSLQKVWPSFSLVSIMTLLTFFLIPTTYSIYYKSCVNRLNRNQNKINKTIDKNEPERRILASNKKEIQKKIEGAPKKIKAEEKRKKEPEAKLYNEIAIIEAAKKSITELQEKLKIERKANDKLRKQLNETIKTMKHKEKIIIALRSKLEEKQTKGDNFLQNLSNNDFSKEKLNSGTNKTDSKTHGQEIIFKVQIISSDTRLATNSLQFKGLKKVWEYRDGGLYKYTVGNIKDFKSAFVLQSEFRKKGFVEAFVVAFRNGKRIPVKKAMDIYKMHGNS